MDGWMDALNVMDEWIDACMDEWMDGWIDGWLDGWKDGCILMLYAVPVTLMLDQKKRDTNLSALSAINYSDYVAAGQIW